MHILLISHYHRHLGFLFHVLLDRRASFCKTRCYLGSILAQGLCSICCLRFKSYEDFLHLKSENPITLNS